MPKVASIQKKNIKLKTIVKEGRANIRYTNVDKWVFLRPEQTFNFIFVLGWLYDGRKKEMK